MKNFNCIFALFLLFTSAYAVAADIDLELTSDIDVVDVEFGQVGTFSLSVTNHGPDAAGVGSSSYVQASAKFRVLGGQLPDIYVHKNNNIAQHCFFSYFYGDPLPTGYAYNVATFHFYDIPAGETKTCYGTFEIRFKEGVRKIDWEAEGVGDNEINPGNETIQQHFRMRPPVVPTIGFYALSMLLLCVLLMAGFRFAKTKPADLNNEKL